MLAIFNKIMKRLKPNTGTIFVLIYLGLITVFYIGIGLICSEKFALMCGFGLYTIATFPWIFIIDFIYSFFPSISIILPSNIFMGLFLPIILNSIMLYYIPSWFDSLLDA